MSDYYKGYRIEARHHHDCWGCYDGTSYAIVDDKGSFIAMCGDEETAECLIQALKAKETR